MKDELYKQHWEQHDEILDWASKLKDTEIVYFEEK